ncbi:hypothetical protein [Rhodohalobacter sulfatireducens]|uniref:hypothetical protein n=1 Tax=Rhodohalobacter sulfatireducens TaxID=2911366 RepID=UPI001EDC2FDA|nr:hypothetical protein [Rhodohalobacter sulfatireducens]
MKQNGLENLNKNELMMIYGGENVPGTFADEIGTFLGAMWAGIFTSHRTRAEGQILATQQKYD